MGNPRYESGIKSTEDGTGRASLQRVGRSLRSLGPRSVMALEERDRERRAQRRMMAFYRSAVLHPGEFSHQKVTREELIAASQDLQRTAARGSPQRQRD